MRRRRKLRGYTSAFNFKFLNLGEFLNTVYSITWIMKRTLLVAIALTGFVSVNAMAQDEVKKEVQKEVKMEVVGGVKT